MLLPEQVLPFLQHDDPIVRGHARRYFRNCYDFGPLTADHYWAAIDRLGENDGTLGFASALSDLPQTDASLRRLLKGLAAETSEDFEFHYQHAARDMEMAVLARNRAELLACPQLLPHVRSHLELRLNLLEESPASAWDRLMQRGRELGGTNAYKFDYSPSDALIEAAARGGAPICELAMNTLADESAAEDWREIFAVQVLGAARYEPAIDALVEKLGIDADVLREDTNRALARIGTSKVVQRLVAFYPGKPWHVRLYTHTPLAHIKRPESCDALLNLLDVELALAADANLDEEGPPLLDTLLLDLTELASLAGLDQSRRLIGEYPDDPETLDLCQCLIATAVMTGRTLPEESTWRKRLKAREARLSACGDLDGMFRGFRDNWRKTGISIAPSVHTDIEKDNEAWKSGTAAMGDYVEPVKPIRNEGPKIGRNDPCPCGSGKKYKKCCRK